YRYSGSDASLLYNYAISPLAQKLVDCVLSPQLAPNAITIGGLSLVILSHICMLWYAPNMEEEAPRWVYANAGLSLLFYQILDVADGKQARKTGNSSPLGLLFDHGCDALNVVISACTFASTIMLGPTYWSLLLFLAPAMVFFMATWEEYYTGTLALPMVNGPNEGLFIMYSCYLGTAIVGPTFWTQPNVLIPGLQNNHVFVLITATSALGQCLLSGSFMQASCLVWVSMPWMLTLLSLGSVYAAVVAIRSLERKAKDGAAALLGLTPFVALIGLSALWVLWSPSDVFTDHPRLLIWTVGLVFAKVGLVELFFVISLAAYMHMIYFVITELATILDIHVFKVKQG
ncbi:hypothetical protein BBJ28_00019147, partial [Nothophytophthora sp. Chile5]